MACQNSGVTTSGCNTGKGNGYLIIIILYAESNKFAERLSISFGHSMPMIPMERGYIARHIDDAEYGNQQP